MKNQIFTQKNILIVLLIAASVIIPFSPLIWACQGPVSFTLAIHTPIFIAMFISPLAAFAVVVSTAMGVWLVGCPAVIVWRASSHILFALLGAWYLQVKPQILSSFFKSQVFSFVIGVIHAWVEVTVVSFFFLNGDTVGTYYSTTSSILLFVGLGGILLSMVDFTIAFAVLKLLAARKTLRPFLLLGKYPSEPRS